MSVETARNIGIIVVLALFVWLAPRGDNIATLILQLLNAVFIVLIAIGLGMLYRRFRPEIYSLGDQWRFGLYAAVGTIVVTLAATSRLWENGAGIALWFGLLAGAAYLLYVIWQRYRAYA